MTRGSLSPSVYWRRRVFVLGTALALILIVVNLFNGGDQPKPKAKASQSAAQTDTGEDDAEETDTKRNGGLAKARRAARRNQTPTAPVLPPPTGTCADDDVMITPSVASAVAGRDVTITLSLQTKTAEACNWQVSAETVALKITSGSDDIWTSGQCPVALPTQDVIVRQIQATPVNVIWNARRSKDNCPAETDWAQKGTYHVASAAYGGEPVEATFELVLPEAEVLPPVHEKKKGKRGDGKAQRHEDAPKLR